MSAPRQDGAAIHCLICNSAAVIDRPMARTLILNIAALLGCIQGWRNTAPENTPAQVLLRALSGGRHNLEQELPAAQAFIADVERFQFAGFDCLCLRCGARFDMQEASVAQTGSQ